MLKTFYFYENGMARKTIYKCLYIRNKILLHGLVKLCKYRVYKHWEKEKVSYSICDERDVKKGRIQTLVLWKVLLLTIVTREHCYFNITKCKYYFSPIWGLHNQWDVPPQSSD